MKMRSIVTAVTAGSFIATIVTGLLIFCEFSTGSVRGTHAWISLSFLFAALLHIFSYKGAITKYFMTRYVLFTGASLISGVLLFFLAFNDIYAAGAAFDKLTNAELREVAPVLGMNSEDLMAEISRIGVSVESDHASLNSIARANGMDVYELVEPLLKQ